MGVRPAESLKWRPERINVPARLIDMICGLLTVRQEQASMLDGLSLDPFRVR